MGDENTGRLMQTIANPTFDNAVTASAGITATAGFLNLGAPTELTIASGAVTATKSRHIIDTESDGASDDLDTISGGTDGDILILQAADDARTVNVTAAGNVVAGANPRALDASEDTLVLVYDGTLSKWLELAFISNAT